MTDFPARGQRFPAYWDLQLKAYIDERTLSRPEIDAEVESAVADAVGSQVPGTEMAYAESTSGGTTTSVYPSVFTVTTMTMQVTGTGRPVDIEFYIPQWYHSVAQTRMYAVIYTQIVGSGVNVYEQIVTDKALANTEGPSWYGKRRKVLTNGVSYYVALAVAGGAAGTLTFGAGGGSQRMFGSVVAR